VNAKGVSVRRAVVLFSGGLDSMLAVRILQDQGWEIEALNVRTTFECCRTPAARAAAALGVRLQIVVAGDDYLDVIRHPKYGYGKAVNPCVDCRIHMACLARRWMHRCGASLVATGEVLGQRKMSQKRVDLDVIAKQSGLEDRLLRPLSAQWLAPTLPEREGLVDRDRLFAFHGQGRRGLIELAGRLGIDNIPSPSTGCRLTEPTFAPRVRDLLAYQPDAGRWAFELLRLGRHLRLTPATKLILGRNADENRALEQFLIRPDASACVLVEPDGFPGPSALVYGAMTENAIQTAGNLVVQYSKATSPARVCVRKAGMDTPGHRDVGTTARPASPAWL
jgi:tRNA-specific 2-thiouridylase